MEWVTRTSMKQQNSGTEHAAAEAYTDSLSNQLQARTADQTTIRLNTHTWEVRHTNNQILSGNSTFHAVNWTDG